MPNTLKINDTVTLHGIINKTTYLSRSDNSDIEEFNDAYNLHLDKSIEIEDGKYSKNKYNDIGHIEIEDSYQFGIYRFTGKKAKIKGILKTFTEQNGYYRQYSTPIKLEIIEIEIEGNDCNGGKSDALKDIEEKKISLCIIGPKRYDGQFSLFFEKFLKEKYNIKLIIYGCEIDNYIKCYEEEMAKELVKLYGENFLEQFEKEAKLKYKQN